MSEILELFKRNLPFLSWIWELRKFSVLKKDIIAWLTVWFVIIPQSMAYAALAELPIEIWLYTWMVAAIIAWFFWATKQMATGPITIVSLMTATALFTVVWDDTSNYVAYASILAIFTWLFYILLWNLRLWIIVDFLSSPLIVWFTNAAALITIFSQAWKLFWVSYDKSDNYFTELYNLFISIIDSTHSPTFIIWLSSVILLIILKKYIPKAPRVLIVVVISTFYTYFYWLDQKYWLKIVTDIPNTLPNFTNPLIILEDLKFSQITDLFMYAMIIWLIWFTQTISVSKFISVQSWEKIDANRELVGQWITNIFTWFFWWYTVAGSLSKTAVNIKAGAKTGLASIVTWLFICVTLLFLTKYLYYMPMVILAAVIMVAVIELIKIKPLIKAFYVEKHDWIVWVFTFIVTLIFASELHVWIFLWILLSLSLFISRSMRPRIVEVSMYKNWYYRDKELFWLKSSKQIGVYRFDWVLYFANSSYFEDKVMEFISQKEKVKYVILDLEWMADIDASGLEKLMTLTTRLKENDIKVYLASVRIKVIEKMSKVWFIDKFKSKNIFSKIQEAVEYIDEKHWEEINVKPLLEYTPKKKSKESEWHQIIKESLK